MGAALAGRRSHGLDSGAGAGAVPELAAPGALYLLLGFTLGLPAWVGDHNPILLFLPFLTVFLLCGGDALRPGWWLEASLYAAGPHWDDGGYSAQTGDQQCVAQRGEGGEQSGEAGMLGGAGAGDLEAGAETCAPVLPPVEAAGRADASPDGHPVLLLWGTGMVGDELVDHFVEGIAYTILPFASLSALQPCWQPWPCSPGTRS